MGVLVGAPDTSGDTYIILGQPAFLKDGEKHPEELRLVDQLLVKYDDIAQIQALKADLAKPKPATWRDVVGLFLPVGTARLLWRWLRQLGQVLLAVLNSVDRFMARIWQS